jgi:hypothetical protein
MATLTHHRLATIYTEAHALAFATDPMYSEMRTRIAGEFGEEFLQLGKPSIYQQAKVALARLAHGNDDLRRKMFSEFATYITRSKDDNANEETFRDFEDTMMKPSELWTLGLQFYQTPAVCSTPQSSWSKWRREKPQVGKTSAQLPACSVRRCKG